MLDGIPDALRLFLDGHTLLILMLGTAIGIVVAILPGIGAPVAMALLLPVTFGMERETALMFLVTIMGAGGFAGSITGILMRVPGDSNVASMLDGYPLARQGRGSEAIGATIAASTLGAVFGIVLLITSLPLLQSAVLIFGSPELFAAAAVGIVFVATVSPGAVRKGIMSGLIGMVLGTVGYNLVTGEVRYAFDSAYLYDGVPLVPAIAGLFALPEMVALMRRNRPVSLTDALVPGGLMRGVRQVLARPILLLKSSAIGAGIGVVPGVGSSVGTWVAYYAAMKSSRDPASFGKGNIEGVIAPEASRDAREGGAMVPLLALGIPGGLATAVLLSGFLIAGVTPGKRLFEQDMPLVWGLILALLFANVVTGVIGLAGANQMAKITLVPVRILVPVILVAAFIGAYVKGASFFGILALVAFGLLGLAMERLRYPRPPLILGMILLPIAENNFFISRQISLGSYDFLLRPVTFGLILLTVVAVAGPRIYRRLRRKGAVAVRPDAEVAAGGGTTSDDAVPVPLRWELGACGVLLLLAVTLAVVTTGYSPNARQFPLIVLVLLMAMSVIGAVMTLRKRPRDPLNVHSDPGEDDEEAEGSFWRATSWIVALPALIWLVGMVPAVFVYVAGFMAFFERRKRGVRTILAAVAVGCLAAIVVSYVFGSLLGIRLPAGMIPTIH